MPARDVIFQDNERVRWVGEVVEQYLDPGIRKRFSDQANNPDIIFQILGRVVGHFLAIVFLEKPGVDLLFRRFELGANVVLFADKNQLSRCSVIVVLQEIMHPKPEILEIEFGEVFAVNRERVKIIVLEIATVLASLLVFPPEKTGGQQDERGDDRRDYINGNVAAESFNHTCLERRACLALLKALGAASRCIESLVCAAAAPDLAEQMHLRRDALLCVQTCRSMSLHRLARANPPGGRQDGCATLCAK